jgi:ubiquinone/menaquinone biosynthesis C-methylase UbiE
VGRALEIGCGPGLLAEQLAPLVEAFVGVDATPTMVELASARLGSSRQARFEVGLAEALPFEADAFDAVITRLTVHHLLDPKAAMKEAHRVLVPGGRLILADILTSSDPDEAEIHNALERLRDPTHVRMLTRGEFESVLKEAGFHVVRSANWEQERAFGEWAAIVPDPSRLEPLAAVMRALTRSHQTAGIELKESGEELRFSHRWYFAVSTKAAVPQAGADSL